MSLGYAVITTSASSSRRFLLNKSLEKLRCRAASRWIFYEIKVISKPICYRGHLRRLSMLSAFHRAYQPPLPWLIGVQAKVRPRECQVPSSRRMPHTRFRQRSGTCHVLSTAQAPFHATHCHPLSGHECFPRWRLAPLYTKPRVRQNSTGVAVPFLACCFYFRFQWLLVALFVEVPMTVMTPMVTVCAIVQDRVREVQPPTFLLSASTR